MGPPAAQSWSILLERRATGTLLTRSRLRSCRFVAQNSRCAIGSRFKDQSSSKLRSVQTYIQPYNLQLKTKLNQKKSTCPRKLEMEITTMRLALKSLDAGYPSGFLPEHPLHKNQTFKPKMKNLTMAPSAKRWIITDQTGLGFQSEVQLLKY